MRYETSGSLRDAKGVKCNPTGIVYSRPPVVQVYDISSELSPYTLNRHDGDYSVTVDGESVTEHRICKSRKVGTGKSVLNAAIERIDNVLKDFESVYVSFSGGKDSSVMLHLAADRARKLDRRIGVLFVDLEAQYQLTIEHVQEMRELVSDVADFYWVALPLALRNAVSVFEPKWQCWDPDRKGDWVRRPPKDAITDCDFFPFFRRGMEFEDFVPQFGEWHGNKSACMVGIRCDESLNRYRTIASRHKKKHNGLQWTTVLPNGTINAYPIYDWKTSDIWTYNAKFTASYNKLYDRMHQAGLTIHQQRICQPYGDDQRKGLWLFHVIEPDTWSRIIARVNGANSGALYSRDTGNIQGVGRVTLPDGHTWESFSKLLLSTMPRPIQEHFECKIAVFLQWWRARGFSVCPDDGPMTKDAPSWRRICKALLRNDYWCKGLSFSPTKPEHYTAWRERTKRKRKKWGTI